MDPVPFQWDRSKAGENVRKHGVDLADAVGVFEDPHAVTIDDPHPDEQRFVTVGMDPQARILVISWAARNEAIRLISARKATPQERHQYQKEK